MKEWKTLNDFSFNRNKFCSIIISLIFFIFSNQVYGESVKDIICVGPTTNAAGEAASEGGTNPCNLHASGAAIGVNPQQHVAQLTLSSSEEVSESPESRTDSKPSGGVQ